MRSAHQRQTLMHTTTLGRRFEAVPQWIAGRLVSSDQYFLPLLFESGRWCPEHPEYPRPRQTTTSVPAMMHPCPLRMPPCRSVLPVTVTRAWLASRSGAASLQGGMACPAPAHTGYNAPWRWRTMPCGMRAASRYRVGRDIAVRRTRNGARRRRDSSPARRGDEMRLGFSGRFVL